MYIAEFPIYNSYQSAWVPKQNPDIFPKGIINMGYQGITDNSVATLFGSELKKTRNLKKSNSYSNKNKKKNNKKKNNKKKKSKSSKKKKSVI